MRYVHLVVQIGLFVVLFRIGEWIGEVLHLTIPGSVIGLLLLFLLLISGVFKEKYIKTGARFMTKHLVLFFIPATVGIMNHVALFKGKGFFLILITIVSTALVMGVSGFISQKVYQREQKKEEGKGEREHA